MRSFCRNFIRPRNTLLLLFWFFSSVIITSFFRSPSLFLYDGGGDNGGGYSYSANDTDYGSYGYGDYGPGGGSTSSYTDSYTSSYTDSYTDGYTGGYEGGYGSGENGYEGAYEACYGNCGPPKVSGFIYEDKNPGGGYNTGDRGIEGEVVQVIKPATYTPAYTDQAYCVTTSTDENGNPTGEECFDAVYHPAVFTPDTVIAQAATDIGGHYSLTGFASGTYKIHHAREPLWPGWSRTTPNDVTLAIPNSVNVSFGVSGPFFTQSPPQASICPASPNIRVSWNPLAGASNYRVYYITSTQTTPPNSTPVLPLTPTSYDFNSSTTPLIPGTQYSFIVAALDNATPPNLIAYSNGQTWSHLIPGTTGYTTFPNCGAPPPIDPPGISLWIITPRGRYDPGGAIPQVNQLQTATINWSITGNPTSVTASTAPPGAASYWNGPLVNPGNGLPMSSGSLTIDTTKPASFGFILRASNAGGSPQIGIPINIVKYPLPYIQTTGGDVHTNESINIPQ